MKHLKTLILTFLAFIISLPAFAATGTVYVDVNGLVCDFCARALEKVFGEQEPVDHINVNLDTKVVTVQLKDGRSMPDEEITKLITDAGYNVVDIRTEERKAEAADE